MDRHWKLAWAAIKQALFNTGDNASYLRQCSAPSTQEKENTFAPVTGAKDLKVRSPPWIKNLGTSFLDDPLFVLNHAVPSSPIYTAQNVPWDPRLFASISQLLGQGALLFSLLPFS